MSDTEEYVQPPIPLESVTPMKLAREPEREDPIPIESSPEALHEAAEPLVDNGPEADVITFRDSETGKVRPAHETVTAEQAAREVAAYRNANEDAREQQGDQAVRDLVDHIQTNAANPDLQPAAQQPEQQVQQEQQQQQTEQTAQQYPPGVDPDVARVLAGSGGFAGRGAAGPYGAPIARRFDAGQRKHGRGQSFCGVSRNCQRPG